MTAYNFDSVRRPEQLAKMQKLAAGGVCAFCPKYFKEHHDNPIEFETGHWIVAKNDYPYEHTALHMLAITKEHVTTVAQLSSEAKAEFLDVVRKIENDFSLTSYALGMRSGDFRFNGGSVEHLHAHIIVGDTGDSENHQKVRFKMSSVPKS